MAVRNNVRRVRRKFKSNPAYITGLLIFLIICVFCIRRHPSAPPFKVDAPILTTTVDDPAVNWARFAYVQYVSSADDLCRAVMLFSELREVGSLALRVLFYPSDWSLVSGNGDVHDRHGGDVARLLRYAAEEFAVLLYPVDELREGDPSRAVWKGAYAKFLAFNLTQYERVVVIGFESVVLNNPDELFLLRDGFLAMPYLYWGKRIGWQLSNQLMVVQPSASEFAQMERAVRRAAAAEKEKEKKEKDAPDLDIINLYYNNTLTPLPAHPYHTLTDEFRHRDWDHVPYLGSRASTWDATHMLRAIKIVHFHDAKVPTPWADRKATWEYHVPPCFPAQYRRRDCRNGNAWRGVYSGYMYRRWNVCGRGWGPDAEE